MKYFKQVTLGQDKLKKKSLFFKNVKCPFEINFLLSIKQLDAQNLEFYGKFKDYI